MNVKTATVIFTLFLGLVGCRSTPPGEEIPTHNNLTEREILDRLSERAEAIDTVSASGVLRLSDPEAASVTVDAVLLAQGDDRLRLRAWKLGRAVIDLTRDGDTLWLWTRGQSNDPEELMKESHRATAEQVGMGWSLVSGRILSQEPAILSTGDPLVLMYPLDNTAGVLARIEIDRRTVTVKRCDIVTPDGVVRQSIEPGRYRLIDGLPLATQITSSSPDTADRRFTLELNEIEINQALPDSAFVPPANATRSP